MAIDDEFNYNNMQLNWERSVKIGMNFAEFMTKALFWLVMLSICNVVHMNVLKRFAIPRIAFEILVGTIFAQYKFDITTAYVPPDFKEKSSRVNMLPDLLEHVSEAIIGSNMMLLGLEMEASNILFQKRPPESLVTYSSLLSSIIISIAVFWSTNFFTDDMYQINGKMIANQHFIELVLGLAVTVAGTASPILTRLMTDAKIGRSDIGKFLVATATHTDFVFSILIAVGYFYHLILIGKTLENTVVPVFFVLVVQIVLAAKVGPILLMWVDRENPEGKQMEGPHFGLSLSFMILLCASSALAGYSWILSMFIVGFCLPREGRFSRMIITYLNYVLTTVLYPTYFLWIGMVTRFNLLEPGRALFSIKQLIVILIVTIVGKVFGTVVSGIILGFHWSESVALGLLLSMKGHIHIYIAIRAMLGGYLYRTTCMVIIVVVFLTVACAPAVVAFLIKRPRRRSPNKKMALQWIDPTSEVNMMLCVQNTTNVPSSINFMEISTGTAEAKLMVYVTDMIELTERVIATLEQGEGMEPVRVLDSVVAGVRTRITDALQAYIDRNDGGIITLERRLALSTLSNMHKEIYALAEEVFVSLLVLPFHKLPRADGNLDEGHPGFRFVNRKILQDAPCSVGILVDRGFGQIDILITHQKLDAAVIFIGGKDDREALVYAERIVQHPRVDLTVIRILSDAITGDNASTSAEATIMNVTEQEEELKLDDEVFGDIYDRQIATGHATYVEKHPSGSNETLSILRDADYQLIIVGRGRRVNSKLTLELNNIQEECPELGRIGDILSSEHFSCTASVLIIQQHSLKKELDILNE